MPTSIEFVAQQAGRLDRVVAEYLQSQGFSVTRSGLKSLAVEMRVNGQVRKLSYELKGGERVAFLLPDPEPSGLVPERVNFSIVYQDEDIAIINKPAGVVVHPAHGHTSKTLVHGLLYELGEKLSSVGGVERPGIVHRLDKDTAGLLIVALTDRAHHQLVLDFQHHRIQKIYYAIVKGHPPESGHIETPIGRNPHDRKKMAVVPSGKMAITDYRVLEYLRDHALLEVSILTGRTHQIRVHMAHIGHPIAGDPLYSRHATRYDLVGIALCAKQLSFLHPVTRESLSFSIDLPEDIKRLLHSLRG